MDIDEKVRQGCSESRNTKVRTLDTCLSHFCSENDPLRLSLPDKVELQVLLQKDKILIDNTKLEFQKVLLPELFQIVARYIFQQPKVGENWKNELFSNWIIWYLQKTSEKEYGRQWKNVSLRDALLLLEAHGWNQTELNTYSEKFLFWLKEEDNESKFHIYPFGLNSEDVLNVRPFPFCFKHSGKCLVISLWRANRTPVFKSHTMLRIFRFLRKLKSREELGQIVMTRELLWWEKVTQIILSEIAETS